jgi:hypothetical protein
MRSYIFTKSERDRLISWLKDDVEDDATRMIFVAVRRDTRSLKVDIELLSLVLEKLKTEGRWMRRSRLPNDVTKRLRVAMDEAKRMTSPDDK